MYGSDVIYFAAHGNMDPTLRYSPHRFQARSAQAHSLVADEWPALSLLGEVRRKTAFSDKRWNYSKRQVFAGKYLLAHGVQEGLVEKSRFGQATPGS